MKQNKIFLGVGALVILLGFILSVNTSQKLNATRTELAGLNEELRESRKELVSTKSQLQDSQKQLNISKTNLQNSQKIVEVATSDIRGFTSELDKSKAKVKAATTRANKLTEQLTVTSRALNDAKLNFANRIKLSENKLGDVMLKLKTLSQKEGKLKQDINAREIQMQRLQHQLTRSINLEKSEKERADVLDGKLKASTTTLESKLAELKREQANASMLKAQLEASIKTSGANRDSLGKEIKRLEAEKDELTRRTPTTVAINTSIRTRYGSPQPARNIRVFLSKIPFREIVTDTIEGHDPVSVWGGGKTPRYTKVYKVNSEKIDVLVEKAATDFQATDNRGNCIFKNVLPGDYYVLCVSGMGGNLGLALQQKVKITGGETKQISLTNNDAIPLSVPAAVIVRARLTTRYGHDIEIRNAEVYLTKEPFRAIVTGSIKDNDPVFVWSSGKGKYIKVYGVDSQKIDALVKDAARYSQTLTFRGATFDEVVPGNYYVLLATGNDDGFVFERKVLIKEGETSPINLTNSDAIPIRLPGDNTGEEK